MSADFARHGNLRLAKRMNYLRVAQARGVVFERQLFSRIVQPKASQAVGIGEFAEAAQLLIAKRGLQFISSFNECHAGIIAAAAKS